MMFPELFLPTQTPSELDTRTWLKRTLHEVSRRDPLAVAREASALGLVEPAFALGYQAALGRLVPSLTHEVATLSVTESGGGHPRAMNVALEQREGVIALRGEKRWATLAHWADLLFVLARAPEQGDRPTLKLVRVTLPDPLVVLDPMPETPFVPGIPHATITLGGVLREAHVLEGDGYDFVRRFRTLEDIFVTLCVMSAWTRCMVEHSASVEQAHRGWYVVRGLLELASQDPDAAETHLTLAGLLHVARQCVDTSASYWSAWPEHARTIWLRDTPLMSIAERVRVQRTERAWQTLVQSGAHKTA